MSDYQGNIIIKNPATPTGPNQNGSAPGVWKLSEALSFIRQGIWPTQGVTGSDPYFNYVSMLLSTTSLGNANNNLFVDSSGAFNPISRNGNTTQGSATPYSANWSVYSDNSGDYLTTGSGSSAFAFGTGNFTIEAWFFANGAVSNWKPMLSVGAAAQGQLIRINQGLQFTGNWGMLYPNDAGNSDVYFDTGSPFPLNQWVHVALVRNGTTLTLYQNGVNVLQKTVGFNFTNTTGVGIGYGQYAGDGVFGGYISNVRIVKGTAVYTANFTPSTAPLTAISGTSLLTCQSNRFRDASANNFTVTPVGDTRITDFAPFSPTAAITYNQSDITNWSGYFDGSGDYLDIAANTALNLGNGDFTFETWFNQTSSATTTLYCQISGGFALDITPSNGTIDVSSAGIAYIVRASQTVAFGTWNHVAVTRSGNVFRVYYNGVQIGTATDTTTFTSNTTNRIGAANTGAQPFIGYLSNTRLVKGSVVYTGAFTPPTTNLTAISGTSLLTLQNAAFTDNSTNNFVITPNGNTTVTGNSPFNPVGYWSNYFDGSGDYLSLSNKITFGTGDFTVEGWVYRLANTSIYDGVFSLEGTNGDWNSGGGGIAIACGNLHLAGFGNVNYSSSVPLNQWTHIACSRSGTSVKVFLNGSEVASATSSTSLGGTAGKFPIIGGFDTLGGSSPRFPLTGFISNLRTVTGTALYTSNFTPPTAPLTAISGTSLLTCQNGRFIDNSTNSFAITVNGNTSIQSFDPFYTSTIASNGGSMYFDGSADFLDPLLPSTSLPGSWTIECWFYATATGGLLFDSRPNSTNGYYPNLGVYSSTQLDFYYNSNSNFITVSGGTLNRWVHIAVVKNGTSLNVYADGASVFSATDSNTWAIGASRPRIGANGGYYGSAPAVFTGYISNFRIINGTAAYTAAFTPPTAPVSPTPNTILMLNGMNAGIYDATAINDMETVGNAQVSTVQSKFGGSSVYFDGSGDNLFIPSNPAFGFGTGDLTIEAWVYLNSLSQEASIVDTRNSTTDSNSLAFGIGTNGSIGFYLSNSTSVAQSAASAITAGSWFHVAGTRSGNTWRTFVNGIVVGTGTNSASAGGASQQLLIGRNINTSPSYMNGYIDDLRITRGVARYTATFTPPTQAFPTF